MHLRWTTVRSGTTDSAGRWSWVPPFRSGATSWRAAYAGDTTHAASLSPEIQVTGVRYASTLSLTGPTRIVDETTESLSMTWTANGSPVSGSVTVQRKPLGSGSWTTYRRLRTNSEGRATARRAAPRRLCVACDRQRLQVVVRGHVRDPPHRQRSSDRPGGLPRQGAATGLDAGAVASQGGWANAVITRISDAGGDRWSGRSWHRGCPVGRSGLRLLSINYWGFDGYRRRGQMVLSAAVVGRAAAALRDMYNRRFPIRRMYRVDRFGWSKKLQGADDYKSMRADNTSAFNCRSVVNRPGVRSPHATGRAVDINTWENPYRSATGLVPNSWWASRSHPKIAWRSRLAPRRADLAVARLPVDLRHRRQPARRRTQDTAFRQLRRLTTDPTGPADQDQSSAT